MPKSDEKPQMTKDVVDKIIQILEIAKNTGKIRKGINETTKAIEKSQAQFVVIAEDVDPAEIVMHLPVLCDEKKIPYAYVPSKQELGRAVGIDVPSAAIGVVDAGEARENLKSLVKKLQEQKK